MKEAVMIIGLLALTVSCKKTYKCTCYDHSDNVNSTEQYKARNLEKAKENCGTNINYGTTSKCSVEEVY